MPPIAQSDHNTIVFNPNLPRQSTTPHCQNYQHITEYSYKNLNNYFCEIKWSDLFQCCFSVDDCWKQFLNIVTNAIQKVAPGQLIKITKVIKPSYPKFIIKAQKQKLQAFHKWHSSGRTDDKNIYRHFSKNLKRIIEDYNKSQESSLTSEENTGDFYRFVNRKLSTHNPILEMKRQDGTFTSNPTEVANIFNNYFCSVFIADDGSDCTMVLLAPSTNLKKIIFTPISDTFKS